MMSIIKRCALKSQLDPFKPIAEAISLLLAPHGEVVIHNLKTGKIAAIFNNFSKRKVGDDSLLDEMGDISQAEDVFPPYFKDNWDGRKTKSVSVVLRGDHDKPIGLLCINLDISKWEQMHHFIRDFIESKVEKPEVLFKNDWREKINIYVLNYLKERGLRFESLDRGEKQKLLLALQKEGAFETKNAASYVAQVLQISRATVYNYLKEKS